MKQRAEKSRIILPNDPDLELSIGKLRQEDLAYALPGAFANYCSEGIWQYARHFSLIEDVMMEVVAGRVKRLIINMPPQNGKSSFISHYFTAWYLGRFPNKKVILTSYEADFAASWGRKARDTLEQFGERIFGIKVSQKSAAANFWQLENHQGYMATAGAGGPITGKGADLMIIDDPIKNQEEALSVNATQKIIDWYRSTVMTRMAPDGIIIIIMTRWSYEDLVGWIEREEMKMELSSKNKWHKICLPAIAVRNDPLGRLEGEALWPERYDLDWLQDQRKWLGTHWFEAMYQQNPTPVGGNLIKLNWFRRYTTQPQRDKVEQIVLSIDTAQKDKEVNDYTVIGVWFIFENHYYLVDVLRDRYDHPKLLLIIKHLCEHWRPNTVLIEDKGSGISIIQHLEQETTIPVISIDPKGDKIMRLQNESASIEAGNVYLPEEGSQPWLPDFEQEIMSFPNSVRKDQVDMLSQFLFWSRELSSGIQLF